MVVHGERTVAELGERMDHQDAVGIVVTGSDTWQVCLVADKSYVLQLDHAHARDRASRYFDHRKRLDVSDLSVDLTALRDEIIVKLRRH